MSARTFVSSRSSIRAAGPLLAAVQLISGCADGPDAAAPETDLAAEAEGAPTTGSADDQPVEITLVDDAFGGLPGSLTAGSRLTVVNDSARNCTRSSPSVCPTTRTARSRSWRSCRPRSSPPPWASPPQVAGGPPHVVEGRYGGVVVD